MSEDAESPTDGVTALAVFYLLLSLYTIITNLIEMIIIARIKTSTSTIFIASLALTDLTMGIFAILPSSIAFLAGSWILGDFMCNVSGMVFNTSLFASLLTVICITLNRYVALILPLYYRKISTNRVAYTLTVLLWTVSVLRSLAPFFKGKTYEYMAPFGLCNYDTNKAFGDQEIYYYAVLIVVPFIFSFAILVFCPLHMTLILSKRQRATSVKRENTKSFKANFHKLNDQSAQTQTRSRMKSKQNERDATITTLLVVAVFLTCYAIYCFFTFYYFSFLARGSMPFTIPDKVWSILETIMALGLNLNSIFNPVIYLFRNTTFRNELMHMKVSVEKFLRCSKSEGVPHQPLRRKTSTTSLTVI